MDFLHSFLVLSGVIVSLMFVSPRDAMAAEPSSSQNTFPEMVLIPAGEYEMGSLINIWEQPIHRVKLDSFYISKYEVTFDQFDAFTDATSLRRRNDSGFGRGSRPVTDVSWVDAVAYAAWLSEISGRKYRLPTEAEWEYAARAGTVVEPYYWGYDIGVNLANCRECGVANASNMTMPVGSFLPNSFGLYDVHGNVWEWVADCHKATYYSERDDSSYALDENCGVGVLRGGGWTSTAFELRSAFRAAQPRRLSYSDVGFRLVLEIDSPGPK